MKKKFLLNIIILVTINLLVKPLYIYGIDAEIQNISTPQEWEIYISFLNLCYIFQLVNDLGIHSFNLQFIPKNRALTSYYVSHILGLKVILAVIYFVCISISFWVLSYDWSLYYLFIWIGLNQVLISIVSYTRSNVSGNGLYMWDSLLSILDRLLLLLTMGYLLYFSTLADDFDIMYFVYAQAISLTITIVIAYAVLFQKIDVFKIQFSIRFIREILPKTIAFALIFLLMTAYSRIDIIMINKLIDDGGYQIDAYSACYRLMEASNMFAYLFAALLLPMIAHVIHNRKSVHSLMSIGLRTISVFSLVISCSLICYRSEILPLFYDRADALFNTILIYLMSSFLCISIAYVFGSSVVASGKVKKLNILFSICLVINIVLNFLLIPLYGATGAAIATLTTQLGSCIGQVYLANKTLQLRWNPREVYTILFYGVSCYLIMYFMSMITSIPWVFSLSIGIISCIIISLCMQMIKLEEIRSILRSRIDS